MKNHFFKRRHIFLNIFKSLCAITFTVSFLNAQVSPIIPGQSLWGITQRIGQTTDTILDVVYSLLDCPCNNGTTSPCSPIAITETATDITLTTPGNYCLANDLVGNITISGNDITLDINNRSVTGVIAVTGEQINLLNGFINPPAPTNNGDSPALTISSPGSVTVDNCVFDCNFNPPAGDAINGRTALLLTQGDILKLNNCAIQGGNGATALSAINGGNGGEGIHAQGSITQLYIQNCFIASGDGGTSGASAGNTGGNGAIAFYARSNGLEMQVTIRNSKITGGNGGNGLVQNILPSIATNGGDAADTMYFFIVNSFIIQNCEIEVGAGGLAGGHIMIGFGGNTGNSGIGIESFITKKGIIENSAIFPRINTPSSTRATRGGNGATGMLFNSGTTNVEVRDCAIYAGNGTSGNGDGFQGAGGYGILFDLNSSILYNIIQNCIIAGGNGGNQSGPGGDCVRISSSFDGTFFTGPKYTEVRNCTFPHSGQGNPAGRAVNDFVNQTGAPGSPSQNSKIYSNLAYDIADTSVAYNIHNTNTESGYAISDPPTIAPISPFANYFVP